MPADEQSVPRPKKRLSRLRTVGRGFLAIEATLLLLALAGWVASHLW